MSVIGIDIGYQTSTIAVPRGGGIEVMLNEYSKRQSPSFVSLCEKNRMLGESGMLKNITNFKNTISSFKHLLGRRFDEEEVQKQLKYMKQVKSEALPDGTVGFRVQHLGETQVYSVTQILGMLLTKMRQLAEADLKSKVTDCCIGVPHYFNDAQRHAFMSAAQLSGLDVKLVNELTATALAYGIYKKDLPEMGADGKTDGVKPRKVIFVDIGHSQTQMAAVDFYKGRLEMKSIASEVVGGVDLDRLLFDHFADEFQKTKKIDIRSNIRASIRLLNECEKLKKLMSANSTPVPLNIECLMNDIDVSGTMKRETFYEMGKSVFDRFKAVANKLLAQCKENKSIVDLADIDSVQIVGGVTRIPLVKEIVEKAFGKEPAMELNTDEAVCRGAALRAAIYSPTFAVRDFAIIDKTMHSIKLSWKAVDGLGEDGDDGSNDAEVYKADSAMNTVKVLSFFRQEDFDLTAEYSDPSSTNQGAIGTFRIQGVTPNWEGKSNKIKSKIRFDENGCFVVDDTNMVEKLKPEPEAPEEEAASEEKKDEEKKDDKKSEESKDDKDKADKAPAKKKAKTSRTVPLTVVTSKPSVLTPEQQNKLLEIELAMQSADKAEQEKSDAKNALEEFIYAARDKLCGPLEPFILEADREALSALLTKYEDWLYDEGEDESKSEYKKRLDELVSQCAPVESRYNESVSRPDVVNAFQQSIVLCRKFVDAKNAGDEKYAHISDEDFKKVTDALAEKEKWLNDAVAKQAALKKHENVAFTTKEAQTQQTQFESTVTPIMNKPVPVAEPPKEEPKEEDKKEETAPSENADGAKEEQSKEDPKPASDDMEID